MRHESVDRYSGRSNFSGFDMRAKIIGTLVFVCGISLLQDFLLLCFSLLFTLCLLSLSGVPAKHIAKRYAIAFPFILFASLSLYLTTGQESAINMFLRISASVLAIIFLVVTTEFFDLLKGLQSLKVPGIMISMLLFTHRYIFVFMEELHRMSLARRARAYRAGENLFDRGAMGVISNTAGMLLVRAYERGLRISDSLMARGHDGRIRTAKPLRFGAMDCVMATVFAFMTSFLLSFQFGVLA